MGYGIDSIDSRSHTSEITNIPKPATDDVLSGKADVSSLIDANDQVNQLFQ